MNPYDIRQDYGRAPFDVRNRLVMIGNWNLPHRISLSPFVVAASGTPFNVTVAPGLVRDRRIQCAAGAGRSGRHAPPPDPLSRPPLGIFNTLPTSAQSIIPPYGYDNPGQFTFNLRLSKTFGFGRETQTADVNGWRLWRGGRRGRGRWTRRAEAAWAVVSARRAERRRRGTGGFFGAGSQHQPALQPHAQRQRPEYLQ